MAATQTQQGWRVLKFGGTSVSSRAGWQTIAHRARELLQKNYRLLVVVSALSGVTDRLGEIAATQDRQERLRLFAAIRDRHLALMDDLELESRSAVLDELAILEVQIDELSPSPTAAVLAGLLACGERLSSRLGVAVLVAVDREARWQDATGLLTVPTDAETDADWLAAKCDSGPDPELLSRLASEGRLHVTQGFIAGDREGRIRLLGRGGSDTAAACMAARIGAQHLEIWTDVPGIFSADPREIPGARLLRKLSYGEARELAAMGARVLHPASIGPVREAGIPVSILDTFHPELDGTDIGPRAAETEAQVKGVVKRDQVTLIAMETSRMWQQAGFLADIFALFKRHGFSVDLIATAEAQVTVTLDPQSATAASSARLDKLIDELAGLAQVRVHTGCVSISLVGNGIRANLGKLADALGVFAERRIHMVTQSANDLNLTLVVDPEHANQLVQKLHYQLIEKVAPQRPEFGPTWQALMAPDSAGLPATWWQQQSARIQERMAGRDHAYIYYLPGVAAAARDLRALTSVDRVLYAVKANNHPQVLRTLAAEGLGFECVSLEEIDHVLAAVPDLTAEQILFTPNFAPREEYRRALESGVQVTVDNLHPLKHWPELFRDRDIFLRIDPGSGEGHHEKVVTAGNQSKFGIPLSALEEASALAGSHGMRVRGLHAHSGSGIHRADAWRDQLQTMLDASRLFPGVRVLDLGGGLGVPERPGEPRLDLAALDASLAQVMADHTDLELWLEPGRYLVAESGVLMARVTQIKGKGQLRYLGIATGMNSLIRPALYGAWHEIVNLTRLPEPATHRYNVVGPICESGDTLGLGRFLPESAEGDLILIANAGAYGAVMSSRYNLRAPAAELVLT